jgi:hypothetical protein
MRIGLGDPIVCDRFLLFALWASADISAIVITLGAMFSGIDILHSPLIQITSSLIGLLQATLLVLAFAPPRPYLEWVRSRTRAWAT